MQILYNNVVRFIEGDYKNETKIYQKFETPRLINEFELKFKYVFNFIWRRWQRGWSDRAYDFCR